VRARQRRHCPDPDRSERDEQSASPEVEAASIVRPSTSGASAANATPHSRAQDVDVSQHERQRCDRDAAAQGHEELEQRRVVRRRAKGRQHESEQRARRVLDEVVAVRDPAVQELVAVLLVEGDVGRLAAL
jgi:hypothetical protein